ncbi:MAG TPA: peptidylprolyl isomerase [Thermohalobaculum sp.]|nr:peptidylprolyl isomerase [Thermohalobaculum sp.]
MLKTVIGVIGCVVVALAAGAAPAQQTLFRPVAIVNDSAITAFDVTQREQLMLALGFQAPNKEALRAAAVDRLIDDRLKIQEARRGGLAATPEAIEAGIEETASNGQMTPEDLRARVRAAGVSDTALNDMVEAGLLWRDMVRSRFASRVEPGEAEISAEIALIQQRASTSYHIAEIGLPLTERGRSEAQTRELAARLSESLNQGGDFEAAARKYSRAPTGPRGGDIGWVPADRMPAVMAEAVLDLAPGQVSAPIPVSGGLSILKVLERRVDAGADIDPNDQELRDRIRQSLSNQQISRLAEGLLQELRRDALIETR